MQTNFAGSKSCFEFGLEGIKFLFVQEFRLLTRPRNSICYSNRPTFLMLFNQIYWDMENPQDPAHFICSAKETEHKLSRTAQYLKKTQNRQRRDRHWVCKESICRIIAHPILFSHQIWIIFYFWGTDFESTTVNGSFFANFLLNFFWW